MSEALTLAEQLVELDGLFTFGGLCGEAAAELRRLHAEVEALHKDAERYRWLMNTPSDWAICVWVDDDEGHAAYFRDSRESHIVDAAIDAAMKEANHG